jgi:nicotinate-nucleotide adenylyltransferase
MPRFGLFGGTFDPPHLGHMILAIEALDTLKLDKILWILTPLSPLKDSRSISSLEQRLVLVNAALKDAPGFELSLIDVNREPPYYAVDTIRLLKNNYPGVELVYIMGSDSLNDLPAWHAPEQFVHEINGLGVYNRPGSPTDIADLEKRYVGITNKTTFFRAPQIEISAADIRQRIGEGRSYKYFLLPAVYEAIRSHNYYR